MNTKVEKFPCNKCGKKKPLHLLDAKPKGSAGTVRALRMAANRGKDFDVLECKACYGPGWVRGNTHWPWRRA